MSVERHNNLVSSYGGEKPMPTLSNVLDFSWQSGISIISVQGAYSSVLAFRKHIEEKGIKRTILHWGATLVIRGLDENELFSWLLPESERKS
jgi:hypothetical protein